MKPTTPDTPIPRRPRRKGRARKGSGSLTQPHGPGTNYLMRWRDAEGKPRAESSGTDDFAKASAMLAERTAAAGKGEAVPERGKRGFTFDDGVKLIEEDYATNDQSSWYQVQRYIDRTVRPFFGGTTKLTAIDTMRISAYRRKRLTEGVNDGTINNELAPLRRMFRLALRAKQITAIPYVPMSDRRGAARQGFFQAEASTAIEAKLAAYVRPPATRRARARVPAVPGPTMRNAVIFARVTGWRFASEVMRLEWARVERAAKVARLDTSKNKRGRSCPYGKNPELVAVMAAQWKVHEELKRAGTISPYVFPDAAGGALFYFWTKGRRTTLKPQARAAWNAAREAAGEPAKLLHDFRRTAVRTLVQQNVPETVAMQVTGHITRTVFDRYAIVDESDLSDAIAAVARASAGKPPALHVTTDEEAAS